MLIRPLHYIDERASTKIISKLPITVIFIFTRISQVHDGKKADQASSLTSRSDTAGFQKQSWAAIQQQSTLPISWRTHYESVLSHAQYVRDADF